MPSNQSLRIGQFHLSITAVFDLQTPKPIFDETFLENENLMNQQKVDPSNFLSNKIKKRNDMATIQEAFPDNRVPSSYDKGKLQYSRHVFDNLLEEEYEIE
jgi:hypothetical protein